jgi:lipopolysaccharide export system protein LptA
VQSVAEKRKRQQIVTFYLEVSLTVRNVLNSVMTLVSVEATKGVNLDQPVRIESHGQHESMKTHVVLVSTAVVVSCGRDRVSGQQIGLNDGTPTYRIVLKLSTHGDRPIVGICN